MAPVSAPLVTTEYRPAVEADVPVSGPVVMISLFFGESGSTFGSTSSTKYLVARPRWPKYFCAHSMLSGSLVDVPFERSTRSKFLAHAIDLSSLYRYLRAGVRFLRPSPHLI